MDLSSPKLLYLVAVDSYFCSHRLPLAVAAKEAGYEVHVATVVTQHEKDITHAGIKIWPLKHLRRGPSSPLNDVRALGEIYQILHSLKPDIIHTVAMKPVLFGSIAGALAGIRRQIHALGGMGYLFISKSLKAKLMRFFVQNLWRLFLRGKKKTLIVQNEDDYKIFVKNKILPAQNVVIIRGSGVDLEQFKPAEPQNPVPIIVCAARMLWDKGIGELVQAAQQLHDQGIDFRLYLCGGVDWENPAAISKEQLLAWSKENYIAWKGHVSEMTSVYSHADIAVLPSYREGLPKSLLEAAACGLPIVTTDTPGCRDVVIPGKTGLLVPPQTVEPLVDALKEYITNPVKRQEHGNAGRLYCEKNFSIGKVIEQTLELYKR